MVVPRWQALPVRVRRGVAFAGAAVLTPAAYLSYVLLVRLLQGHPLSVEPLWSGQMALYALVLALTGVVATLDWYWGIRATPLLAVGGLLVWPWVYLSIPVGNVGYVSIPFAGVLVATVLEGALRFPERVTQLQTGTVGRYALAVGFVHFVLGFGLQVYARRFFWMGYTFPGNLLMGIVYLVSGLALVATGVLPVILWKRRRLVIPPLVTAGWFLWGLYGTWRMRDSLPWGAFSGINWISFTPYPDYMLQWTVLMVALLALSGGELLLRTALSDIGTTPAGESR